MKSGHGGIPGKFESCRSFEVGFHNNFPVHPGTKTAACLHAKYAFSSRDGFHSGLFM